jgi:tetratricopeptide (TPR) repeat protein
MRNGLGHVLNEQKKDLAAAQVQYELAYEAASHETPPDKEQMANALTGLGEVYFMRNDPARSLDYLDRAIATDPAFGSAHVGKGMTLLALGRADEAQQVFSDAYRAYPNDVTVINGLGSAALARHDTAAAIEYFSRAIETVPSDVGGYLNLGRAYLEANRVQEAIPPLRHATELAPENPLAHAMLGSALGRAAQYPEARIEFNRALSLDPSFDWARQSLQVLDRLESTGRQ